MVKCINCIKNFVVGMFVQDESVGLKSIEKIKVRQEIIQPKKNDEFKFSDIMK